MSERERERSSVYVCDLVCLFRFSFRETKVDFFDTNQREEPESEQVELISQQRKLFSILFVSPSLSLWRGRCSCEKKEEEEEDR
jgi:hypothetical protein